jgi:hypothetical protein
MHYANGRAAKVGDLVRGKGYNLKHEFTGVLLAATPESSVCNCTVATVSQRSITAILGTGGIDAIREAISKGWQLATRVEAYIEYGQLDAFVALDSTTGEVLPPE